MDRENQEAMALFFYHLKLLAAETPQPDQEEQEALQRDDRDHGTGKGKYSGERRYLPAQSRSS